MTMHTLSRWVDRLLDGPTTIECPQMEILGHDHEPPVFTGTGHIEICANTDMRFVMHATPRDGSEAFRKIMAAENNPYDHLQQFRMKAVGYDGTNWAGGWSKLRMGEQTRKIWRLSGPIHALHTHASGHGVAKNSSVELVYDQPLRLPIPMNMIKTVQRDGNDVFWSRSSGSKVLDVLGTRIEFFQAAEHKHIWAVANTSAKLPHPYLENWLSEPLNLLLGEVVAPRLKARNFGDGKATISLHRASGHRAQSLAACILREDPLGADTKFWGMYVDILTLISAARDTSGHRNFEAHPLTQYYWEIIQASRGSNWVLCMTLASTIEGIVKRMFSEDDRKSDWPQSDLDELKRIVKDWGGNNDLRSVVLNYLSGFKTKGIAKTLKSLTGTSGITKEQIDAWERLRNSSMHGEMAVPWSDAEQDARMDNLLELTHRLSEAYIKKELEKCASYPAPEPHS